MEAKRYNILLRQLLILKQRPKCRLQQSISEVHGLSEQNERPAKLEKAQNSHQILLGNIAAAEHALRQVPARYQPWVAL